VTGEGPRPLCALDDLPDPASRGFAWPGPDGSEACFAVRRGDRVDAYLDSCPHIGVTLEWLPDRVLTADGALFLIENGECVRGPCRGQALTPVAVVLRAGKVWLREDTG
jgi:nitrite reductase/ring-hydroxylating ferredoxin subunit